MSVTRTTGADVYTVKKAGEWATIVVRAWTEGTQGEDLSHRGQLLINSTYGSWSNDWSAPGMPFKQFLVSVEFGYLMSKLLGRDLDEYDGNATFNYLKSRMLEMRRKGRVDKGAAAWLWREINERHELLVGSVERFVEACGNILKEAGQSWSITHTRYAMDEIRELMEEPWLFTRSRVSPHAKGFWRDIWSEFIKAVEDEIVSETETAYERPRG